MARLTLGSGYSEQTLEIWDTGRELPLSKITPSLETSLSFHEVGTSAAKRSTTVILALSIDRQAHMLGTSVQSHQEDPR